MSRKEIFQAVCRERRYQDSKWGSEFDRLNTPNDWVTYLVRYVGKAVTMPFDEGAFRNSVLKVAALCFAILERKQYAKRHYDTGFINDGGKK